MIVPHPRPRRAHDTEAALNILRCRGSPSDGCSVYCGVRGSSCDACQPLDPALVQGLQVGVRSAHPPPRSGTTPGATGWRSKCSRRGVSGQCGCGNRPGQRRCLHGSTRAASRVTAALGPATRADGCTRLLLRASDCRPQSCSPCCSWPGEATQAQPSIHPEPSLDMTTGILPLFALPFLAG